MRSRPDWSPQPLSCLICLRRDDSWPWWFTAYVVVFIVHWSVLLLIVSVRLWRAGRSEASVARRRMEMLAVAATAITAALVLAAAGGDDDSVLALVTGLVATLSAVAFMLGFAPPERAPTPLAAARAAADATRDR